MLTKKLIHCLLLLLLLTQMDCTAREQGINANNISVKELSATVLNHQQVHFKPLAHPPQALKETSGLALFNNQLWSINDSGDTPTLYGLSAELNTIEHKVTLSQATNKDWESLASDEEHLYIADCGNNSGARHQFTLYQVPWQSINEAKQHTIEPSLAIVFSYLNKPAQLKKYQHNFDCEAITLVNDTMWLFSKNWENNYTDLYHVPLSEGSQSIASQATYNINGLITAADYHPKTQQLALLGYSKNRLFGHAFVWLFDVRDNKVVTTTAQYYQLPLYAQWEGIVWQNDKQLIISTEQSPLSKVMIAQLTLSLNEPNKQPF
ncbi:hypothetical protein [Pseudoalteromonas ulvae]|nr:hypothetical protein [Pseudoalteromonas ulvae]